MGQFNLTSDGRCVLVFERHIPHAVTKVWSAITELAHLRRWFAGILDYDRSILDFSAEATLKFVPRAEYDQIETQTGLVEQFEPPRLLRYTWGPEILIWELEPTANGGCSLTFTNVFDDRDFAPHMAVGWHTGLDRLADHLGGDDPENTQLERDEAVANLVLHRYQQMVNDDR